MPPKVNAFTEILRPVWSHLLVAGITSIISFIFITGTYKGKIDGLMLQTQENQVSIQHLADVVAAQTVQIAELRVELRMYQFKNHPTDQ